MGDRPEDLISIVVESRVAYWIAELDLLNEGITETTWNRFMTKVKKDVVREVRRILAELDEKGGQSD